MKRALFTDETVNRYGFRVLTSGGRLDGFKKNPVMLFNHDRYSRDYAGPIGKWTDLKVEENAISGAPEFDLEDDFAKKIANKWQKGFLNATSIGFTVLKISTDEKDMLPGQRYGTITEWELKEVSIVDIPANKNALKLYDKEGNEIKLDDETELMKLGFVPQKKDNQKPNTMKIILKKAQEAALAFFGTSVPDGKDSIEKELSEQEVENFNAKLREFKENEQKLADLNTKLQIAQTKLSDTEAKLGTANTSLSQKDTEIQQLKDKVASLEKKTVPPSGAEGGAGGNEDGKELSWMEDPKQKNLSFNQQALELLGGI